MKDSITTTYNGVKIEYDEDNDLWRFHIRGRERLAKSLKNAKAAIDKPEPGEKKEFKPVEAYLMQQYSVQFEKVTVTSIAANGTRGREVWITRKKGSRSKERLDDTIYTVSPKNDEIFSQIDKLERQRDEASEQQKQLRKRLEHLVIDDN